MQRIVLFIGCLVAGLIFPLKIAAEITIVHHNPPAEARIRVGAVSGATTVVHNIPVANIGDGTPISGVPAGVVIEVSARRASAREMNHVYYVVTADSSVPLSSGLDTIPFTGISWTSQSGDIPAGRFDGTSAQVILGPTRAKYMVSDRLTFIYDNDQPINAGTYSGSVTYTISIP